VPDAPPGSLDPATTPNPSGPITVSTGSTFTIEIGFQPSAGLSGTAFADANDDGVHQPGERGLGQLLIDIYEDDGDGVFDPNSDRFVTTVSTNALGSYTAEEVTFGDYWLVPFTPPLPSLPSAPVAASVASGPASVDIPFAQAEAISGLVVFDADGILDDSLIPVLGVAVSVFLDDGDGIFDAVSDQQVATRTTNTAGEFIIASLPPGSHFVRLDPSTLQTLTGLEIIGDNPIGPIPASTSELIFAFDPTSIELPATGATATHVALRLGGASFAIGLLLLAGTRRRRRAFVI
jgi:LPXTG-motif cell wall-anchored protein